MCGIFGVVNFSPEDLDRCRSSLNTLSHRGPDQWGDWHSNNIYLGHRRLSIIDLSENAKQPMYDKDENIIIVVNGEIYNFLELKKILEQKYVFRSKSDSEVILHGYKEWGINGLIERIDGMFAFVVHDRQDNSTYVVRDRFGIKPIYFAKIKDQVLFSSEIKAILNYDDDFRTFSLSGIKEWVLYRGHNSNKTIYHNIFRIPPGKFIKIKGNNIKFCTYYDVLDQSFEPFENFNYDYLDSLLTNSVSKRLMSDVPVGLQLSGGVDSSLLGAYLLKNSSNPVHSFSIGFAEDSFKSYNEESYATYASDKIGSMHHQFNITKKDIVDNFEDAIYYTDGYLDYPNTIALNILSKHMNKYVTVSIGGEGADELYGGYGKFQNGLKLNNLGGRAFSILPYWLINNFVSKYNKTLARYLFLRRRYSGDSMNILNNINSFIDRVSYKSVFGDCESTIFDSINYEKLKKLPFERQLLVLDHKTYLYSLLERQDKATMGASIEGRVPFLDKELVEYSLRIPQKFLFSESQTKIVLKSITSHKFNEKFVNRPKKGFPLPIVSMIDDPNGFKPYLDKIYESDFILKDYINIEGLGSIGFDNRNINYSDSSKMWLKYFLMVIRTTQDTFKINNIIND